MEDNKTASVWRTLTLILMLLVAIVLVAQVFFIFHLHRKIDHSMEQSRHGKVNITPPVTTTQAQPYSIYNSCYAQFLECI